MHNDCIFLALWRCTVHYNDTCLHLLYRYTVYPKKYAHGFVVLCFVVVMQSFIMNSHAVFIHIHQGCFAGTGAIVRLPQCQWSKPDAYGKISQCITTTKHSKAKTVCIFLGIYCIHSLLQVVRGLLDSFIPVHGNYLIDYLCVTIIWKRRMYFRWIDQMCSYALIQSMFIMRSFSHNTTLNNWGLGYSR